jgi:hypothetical protein
LIEEHPEFATAERLYLADGVNRPEYGNAGVLEGLMTPSGPTEKGKKFWKENGDLVKPARRKVVEVTGITDIPMMQNMKEAEFKWRYVDLPEVIARYCGQGKKPHDGTATFQLFDDGWRVKEVRVVETGRESFVWPKELEAEAIKQREAEAVAKAKAARERLMQSAIRASCGGGDVTIPQTGAAEIAVLVPGGGCWSAKIVRPSWAWNKFDFAPEAEVEARYTLKDGSVTKPMRDKPGVMGPYIGVITAVEYRSIGSEAVIVRIRLQ